MERIEVPWECKAAHGSGEVEGYGSVFGNIDLGGDVMIPGAFAGSLEKMAKAGKPIPMLWQHDTRDPVGLWSEYREDDRGLYLGGRILVDTTRGRDAIVFAKNKVVTGLSIGFVVKDASEDMTTGIRRIKEVDLLEVSLVTFPMNEEAQLIGAKFLDAVEKMSERDLERWLREACGRTRREAKAAVSRLLDLGAERDAADIQAKTRTELAAQQLLSALKSQLPEGERPNG